MNTLQIELASPTSLKILWPLFDDAIDHEIRRRLSTVPGIEAGRGRVAWAPIIQLARLMALFPKASFDYRAMQESDCLARRYFDGLVAVGVKFDLDEFGDPMGVGDNVSPLLQQQIHERRHALKPFVIDPPARITAQVEQQPEPSIAHLYPKPKRRRAKKRTKA